MKTKEPIFNDKIQQNLIYDCNQFLSFSSKVELALHKEKNNEFDITDLYFKNQNQRFNIILYDICSLYNHDRIKYHYGLLILYRSLLKDSMYVIKLENEILKTKTIKPEIVNPLIVKHSNHMMSDYSYNFIQSNSDPVTQKKIINFFKDMEFIETRLDLEKMVKSKEHKEYMSDNKINNLKYSEYKKSYEYCSKFDHFSFYTIQEIKNEYSLILDMEKFILKIHFLIIDAYHYFYNRLKTYYNLKTLDKDYLKYVLYLSNRSLIFEI